MKLRKGIDRREFLQGSAALLGAGSVRRAEGGPARTSGGSAAGPEVGDNGSLGMKFALGPNRKVWILAAADSGFQEKLAGKELARGLRKLGLAGAPIEAASSETEAKFDDIVFTLRVDKEAFKDSEVYEIRQETAPGNGSRVRLTGATPQAIL